MPGVLGVLLTGVLAGQALTGDTLPLVSGLAGPAAISTRASTTTNATTTATQPKDDDTPWGFFKDNVGKANSVGKWLMLIFIAVVLTALYLPLLWKYIVISIVVLALVVPRVRRSRLVLIGFALFLLGILPLMIAGRFTSNPLGFGFLFAFTQPLAAVLMVLGATVALFRRSDKRLNEAVATLITAAERKRPVWPDDPPLSELDGVATHGTRAGPALAALLTGKGDEPSAATSWNVHVEQQAELALCRIYGVLPSFGETVADARSTREDNSGPRAFWRAKVGRGTT